MGWGFATWDASGVDNNTGLVKINSLGIIQLSSTTTGSYSFDLPPGYTLDFLVQPAGDYVGRRYITVSGNTITISSAGSTDYSANTYPSFAVDFILVYAR